MGYTLFERLGLTPFRIHMVWKKITSLPSMGHNVRFGNGPSQGLPSTVQYIILKNSDLMYIVFIFGLLNGS